MFQNTISTSTMMAGNVNQNVPLTIISPTSFSCRISGTNASFFPPLCRARFRAKNIRRGFYPVTRRMNKSSAISAVGWLWTTFPFRVNRAYTVLTLVTSRANNIAKEFAGSPSLNLIRLAHYSLAALPTFDLYLFESCIVFSNKKLRSPFTEAGPSAEHGRFDVSGMTLD